jgi:hypothetical protein
VTGLTRRHACNRARPPISRHDRTRFGGRRRGYPAGTMNLALLLIVIGIVLAVLVHYALGIVCILIGLVLLLWPRLRTL